MTKVGITGQSGFIGTHLANAVAREVNMELVPFEDSFFVDEKNLRSFVNKCDAIIHLAARSRAPSEEELYKTNMGLVEKLIKAMDTQKVTPHVLFSSSTHETRNTAYGHAKRDGRALLARWAEEHGSAFTGFIFPNVFGPGARVHYASFIANFAWELNHGEEPKILVDAPIKLIYVENLVGIILKRVREIACTSVLNSVSRIVRIDVPYDFEKKVTEILSVFREFKAGAQPDNDTSSQNLYNTFISYK